MLLDVRPPSRFAASSLSAPPPILTEFNVSPEADSVAELRKYASSYKNRICVPMSKDAYMEITRHHLEAYGIHYARVPFRRRDEVYYFFNDYRDVSKLLEVMSAP